MFKLFMGRCGLNFFQLLFPYTNTHGKKIKGKGIRCFFLIIFKGYMTLQTILMGPLFLGSMAFLVNSFDNFSGKPYFMLITPRPYPPPPLVHFFFRVCRSVGGKSAKKVRHLVCCGRKYGRSLSAFHWILNMGETNLTFHNKTIHNL